MKRTQHSKTSAKAKVISRTAIASTMALLFASSAFAAPGTPSLKAYEINGYGKSYGFVHVDQEKAGSNAPYKDYVTVNKTVDVPLPFDIWSNGTATKAVAVIDGVVDAASQVTLTPGSTQTGTVIAHPSKPGKLNFQVRAYAADGSYTDSSALQVMVFDTRPEFADDLPNNVPAKFKKYTNKSGSVVGSYFTTWSIYDRQFDMSQVPVEQLTHILYGFIPICGGDGINDSLKEQGNPYNQLQISCKGLPNYSVAIHDSWGEVAKVLPGQTSASPLKGVMGQMMAAKKRNPNLKILPSIGGWTLSDPFFQLDNVANRKVFVDSVEQFLRTWKFFDGVDIDWEFPGGNGAKASINIGQQVPIVTTTNANGVVTESVAYQNVGLTLKVEPRISLDNEVGVKVNLEVSNILSKEVTKTGLTAYTLGTRKAETLMSAHDDETQVLAGLINRNESMLTSGLPYLSTLPGVGRLFGSNSKSDENSEIVLLITPHIERNLELPTASTSTFMSGTEAEVTSDTMTLSEPPVPAVADGGPLMTDTISPAVPPQDAGTPVPDAAAQAPAAAPEQAAAPAAPASDSAPAGSSEADTPRFGGATTGPAVAPQPADEGANPMRGMGRGSAPEAHDAQQTTSETGHATVPAMASRGSERVSRIVVAARAWTHRLHVVRVSLPHRAVAVHAASLKRSVVARVSSPQRVASAQATSKPRMDSTRTASPLRVVASRASSLRQAVAAYSQARKSIAVARTQPAPHDGVLRARALLPFVSKPSLVAPIQLVGQPWALPAMRPVSLSLRQLLRSGTTPATHALQASAARDGLA